MQIREKEQLEPEEDGEDDESQEAGVRGNSANDHGERDTGQEQAREKRSLVPAYAQHELRTVTLGACAAHAWTRRRRETSASEARGKIVLEQERTNPRLRAATKDG